jgi:hypothetical protein
LRLPLPTGAEAAGLQPHAHHPPRKITVLIRKPKVGRDFENLAAVKEAVRETGLPVDFVDDMGKLSFKQQVRGSSRAGAVVGPIGANEDSPAVPLYGLTSPSVFVVALTAGGEDGGHGHPHRGARRGARQLDVPATARGRHRGAS